MKVEENFVNTAPTVASGGETKAANGKRIYPAGDEGEILPAVMLVAETATDNISENNEVNNNG